MVQSNRPLRQQLKNLKLISRWKLNDERILLKLNPWACAGEGRARRRSRAACSAFPPWRKQSGSSFHPPEFQRGSGRCPQRSAKDTAACNIPNESKLETISQDVQWGILAGRRRRRRRKERWRINSDLMMKAKRSSCMPRSLLNSSSKLLIKRRK